MSKESCFVIGVGGGTGSGKSTLARALQRQLEPQGRSVLISMDDYYLDQRSVPKEERVKANYDHPSSMDVALLAEHLKILKLGEAIEKPVYDFKEHTRKEEVEIIDPVKWILVEGILTLHYEELLKLFDMTIFVDAPADIRFIRRLTRDTKERGRTMDSVLLQYHKTVRPMHEKYVEPSKVNAEYLISGEQDVGQNIVFLLTRISSNTGKEIDILPVQVDYE